jgi:hypothetical protein
MSAAPILLFVLVAAAIYLFTSSPKKKEDDTSTPNKEDDTSTQGEAQTKLEWTGNHLYELESDSIDLLNSFIFMGESVVNKQVDIQIDKNFANSFLNYYKVKSVKIFFSSSAKIIAEIKFTGGMSVNVCVSKDSPDFPPYNATGMQGDIGDATLISTNKPEVKLKKVSGSLSCSSTNRLTIRCPSKKCPSGSSVKQNLTSFSLNGEKPGDEEISTFIKDIVSMVMSKCGCVINNNSTNPFFNKKLKDSSNNEYDIGQKITMYQLSTDSTKPDDCTFSDGETIAWHDDDSSTIITGISFGGPPKAFRYKAGTVTDLQDTRNTVSLVNNITAKDCKPKEIGACSIM